MKPHDLVYHTRKRTVNAENPHPALCFRVPGLRTLLQMGHPAGQGLGGDPGGVDRHVPGHPQRLAVGGGALPAPTPPRPRPPPAPPPPSPPAGSAAGPSGVRHPATCLNLISVTAASPRRLL